jgi:Tol biopolymer transport system component
MPVLPPDIIRRQAAVGAVALSPDGASVAYARRTVAGDRYQTDLWLVPYRGGRPRPLTHGAWSDSAPAWSPGGESIAFASDRGGKGAKAALYLIRPDGGEAQRVCAAPHGDVGAPVWSPDGRRIAFTAEADPPRF